MLKCLEQHRIIHGTHLACILFRHIAQKSSVIRQVLPAFFGQSAEKSDCAICAPELCGIALEVQINSSGDPAQQSLRGRTRTHRVELLSADEMHNLMVRACLVLSDSGGLLEDPAAYAAIARAVNPYRNGRAVRRISDALERFLWRSAGERVPPEKTEKTLPPPLTFGRDRAIIPNR